MSLHARRTPQLVAENHDRKYRVFEPNPLANAISAIYSGRIQRTLGIESIYQSNDGTCTGRILAERAVIVA